MFVGRDVPPRLGFRDHKQLDRSAATARTAHADAPVFPVVTRQDQVATGQDGREAVPFDDLEATGRPEFFPRSPEPAHASHRALPFPAAFRDGSPSNGSFAPRPKTGFAALGKACSAS